MVVLLIRIRSNILNKPILNDYIMITITGVVRNYFVLDTDYVSYSTSYYCEVLRDPQGVYYMMYDAFILSRTPTMTESELVISNSLFQDYEYDF